MNINYEEFLKNNIGKKCDIEIVKKNEYKILNVVNDLIESVESSKTGIVELKVDNGEVVLHEDLGNLIGELGKELTCDIVKFILNQKGYLVIEDDLLGWIMLNKSHEYFKPTKYERKNYKKMYISLIGGLILVYLISLIGYIKSPMKTVSNLNYNMNVTKSKDKIIVQNIDTSLIDNIGEISKASSLDTKGIQNFILLFVDMVVIIIAIYIIGSIFPFKNDSKDELFGLYKYRGQNFYISFLLIAAFFLIVGSSILYNTTEYYTSSNIKEMAHKKIILNIKNKSQLDWISTKVPVDGKMTEAIMIEADLLVKSNGCVPQEISILGHKLVNDNKVQIEVNDGENKVYAVYILDVNDK